MKELVTNTVAIIAGIFLMLFAMFLSALPYAVVLAMAIAIVRCTGVL